MISPESTAVMEEVRAIMEHGPGALKVSDAIEIVKAARLLAISRTLSDIDYKLGNFQDFARELTNMVRNAEYKVDGIVNGVNGIAGEMYKLNEQLKAPPDA